MSTRRMVFGGAWLVCVGQGGAGRDGAPTPQGHTSSGISFRPYFSMRRSASCEVRPVVSSAILEECSEEGRIDEGRMEDERRPMPLSSFASSWRGSGSEGVARVVGIVSAGPALTLLLRSASFMVPSMFWLRTLFAVRRTKGRFAWVDCRLRVPFDQAHQKSGSWTARARGGVG